MKFLSACAAFGLSVVFAAAPSRAAVIYNNLTPTNAIAMATRPDSSPFEIETADDFTLAARTQINSASFVGLIVPGAAGTSAVLQVVVEIYRVFPLDSDVGRTSGPPSFSTPQVPTRTNSPSDVAFDSRDSAGAALSFSTSTLSASFTALNSVAPGGIHPAPGQTTLGNGPVTGQEVEFDISFALPFDLPANHYFFVPQVLLSNGGQFYWLSASRPISGSGTPFAPDLQAWTRDAALDPDWLRVGTDIIGTGSFNAAFSLNGSATTVPEPPTVALLVAAFGMFALRSRRRG